MTELLRRWRDAEPVRLYLYGLLMPAAAIAAAYGLATGEQLALWLGLGAAVLLPVGTERARSRVTPASQAEHDQEAPQGRHARQEPA